MRKLMRLVYISRATDTSGDINRMQATTDAILQQARTFNLQNGITGILCFSDNCFFQCLEGEAGAVERLFASIEKDARHDDVKVVLKETISARSFSQWSMKYVPDVKHMIPLIKLNGHKMFDPYAFSQHLFRDMLDFLSQRCGDLRQTDQQFNM